MQQFKNGNIENHGVVPTVAVAAGEGDPVAWVSSDNLKMLQSELLIAKVCDYVAFGS